eukprot:SAG22_NODE_17926_length_296_cov_0.786802_1_plen_46_part_10
MYSVPKRAGARFCSQCTSWSAIGSRVWRSRVWRGFRRLWARSGQRW